jgi:methionyl-tRNA formyltransferase
MNVVLLTTDTAHHLHFAWKVRERFPLQAIFLETRSLAAPFDTAHPFEAQRDAYEKETLLSSFSSSYADLAQTMRFASINDAESVAALSRLQPDVAIVFGCGKLNAPVIESPSAACLNLHGGNPEHYRGLDSHLWAIYHGDFDNLVTTLHHVDAALDTGRIVFQDQLELHRNTGLHQLRAINTKSCVKMTLLALSWLDAGGALPCRKQVQRGRYYSFMPAALKEVCLKKFEQHILQL